MKSVRSISHATKAAVQSGATLEVGGRMINAGGAKLSVIRPKPASAEVPQIAPPPVPAQAGATDDLMYLLAIQAQAQSKTMLEVVDRLQAPPAPPPVRMRPVAFAVLRDSDDKPYALAPRYSEGAASAPVSFDIVKGADGFASEIVPRYAH